MGARILIRAVNKCEPFLCCHEPHTDTHTERHTRVLTCVNLKPIVSIAGLLQCHMPNGQAHRTSKSKTNTPPTTQQIKIQQNPSTGMNPRARKEDHHHHPSMCVHTFLRVHLR